SRPSTIVAIRLPRSIRTTCSASPTKATTTPRRPLGFEPTTARRNGRKRQRYPDGHDCGGDPLVQPERAPEPQRVQADRATYYEGPGDGWLFGRGGCARR